MRLRRPIIVLYVTRPFLMASLWDRKIYQSHQVYQNEETGYTSFRQWLAGHQKAIVYLVVDTVEEEFQLTLLPHITGAARREMVLRKLTEFHRNCDYKTAYFLNRQTTLRQDDAYILYALSNSGFLQHWMDVLQSENALLARVTSMPMVSRRMVKQSKQVASHLLLCERLSVGLRLSYLQHGRLRISRLVPLPSKESALLTDDYLVEIEKMRLYLLSQKVMASETTLAISLSAFDRASDAIVKMLEQRAFQCSIHKRQDQIRSAGLSQSLVQKYPELLHMHCLASGCSFESIAPAEKTRRFYIQQVTQRLVVGMLMLIVMSLFAGVYLLLQAKEMADAREALQQQTAVLLQNQNLTLKPTDGVMTSSELKNVVMMAEKISQSSAMPAALMQVVSAALEDEPSISINRMRWVHSEYSLIKDEDDEYTAKKAAHSNMDNWVQVGFVNAEIKPFTGDYRTAVAIVNRFLEKLAHDVDVTDVVLLHKPVNGESMQVLRGSTSEQAPMPTEAAFKLAITLKSIEN